MPIYEYECPQCSKINEHFSTIANKPDRIWCPACGVGACKPIISRIASVRPDIEPYLDENLGDMPVVVEGRKHRRELMKSQGLEEVSYDKTKKKEVLQKLEHVRRTKGQAEKQPVL